ncbi:hypothetical protein AVEN_47485-1 [Araneus ventricosus]|uniref:DDE-1 domain-containing protein n=1 Tax=Araneus ventricosus TaxID=182803 RepID=A0A4Y2JKG2_ARAVE|nr:hypothetical protein AVEN_47485-1 [Araneus ventricosus]
MDQSSLSPTQHYISCQPMNQGVIRSLKCHYRKQLISRILECYDKNKDCDISILDTVVLLEKSWRLVTQSTIRNGFSHVGLTKTQQTEDDNIRFSKWLEKHGVNAFSQNEIEHFECCDDDVITCGEVSEEDIVALEKIKKQLYCRFVFRYGGRTRRTRAFNCRFKSSCKRFQQFFLPQRTSTNILWTYLK